MWHRLRRHPLPVSAFFRHTLVLTYAFPRECLIPLLPPGLELDGYKDHGFLAIALVQTERLRPSMFPSFLGRDFFLCGYRIFARYRDHTGRSRRGLRILRSYADRRLMVAAGNLLTHYHYQLARITVHESSGALEIQVRTPRAEADLHVMADLTRRPALLPPDSPFDNLREARRFAGPLPFTFDYEAQTDSIIIIEGVRQDWTPQSLPVLVRENTFLDSPAFALHRPILANAFYVANVPYQWRRGIVEPLIGSQALRRDQAPIYSSEDRAARLPGSGMEWCS